VKRARSAHFTSHLSPKPLSAVSVAALGFIMLATPDKSLQIVGLSVR